MKIYFIRHGETIWNKEKKIQGQSDIPLNEYGKELAHITADAIKDIPFDIVYSSPLIRALETAEILVKKRDLDILVDSRLTEMCFGEGEGESLPEIHSHPEMKLYNFIHNPGEYIPPTGGESFEELYERCKSFIEDIILPAENKYQSMLIVGHGALIRGFIHSINKRPSKDFWKMIHKNCSVTIVECCNGKLSVLEEAKIYYKEDIQATW
ncbi:MAG: histidine phosphatase family protein [Lachnospiraceae bacterium]|nr:histidine phosphatase family protein [Lachnospiraceae bacterium]